MIEIKIIDNDAGQRLNKFLMKYLSQAPSSFVYKMLRKKNIVLNDKKAKGDELLCTGDNVKLYLSDDTIAKFRGTTRHSINHTGAQAGNIKNFTYLSKKLNVLYENNDIMAVHKDAGILSQKATKDDYSINEVIVDYIGSNDKYQHSETFKPSVCNRLDKNTSGIILAGITLKGSQFLSKALKDRSLNKYYFTIVSGEFSNSITSEAYISKDSERNYSSVISKEEYNKLCSGDNKSLHHSNNYLKIMTKFIPIATNKKSTLLKIKLITGKSHQIRAHLKYLGYPMAGDMKYGNKSYNAYMKDKYDLKTHLLHAGIVQLDENTVIKDPLPKIFLKICAGEGLDCSDVL